jgi:hypothetical protein
MADTPIRHATGDKGSDSSKAPTGDAGPSKRALTPLNSLAKRTLPLAVKTGSARTLASSSVSHPTPTPKPSPGSVAKVKLPDPKRRGPSTLPTLVKPIKFPLPKNPTIQRPTSPTLPKPTITPKASRSTLPQSPTSQKNKSVVDYTKNKQQHTPIPNTSEERERQQLPQIKYLSSDRHELPTTAIQPTERMPVTKDLSRAINSSMSLNRDSRHSRMTNPQFTQPQPNDWIQYLPTTVDSIRYSDL